MYLTDDDYIECGKVNDANVLLYEGIQIKEEVDMDNDSYEALSDVENQSISTIMVKDQHRFKY